MKTLKNYSLMVLSLSAVLAQSALGASAPADAGKVSPDQAMRISKMLDPNVDPAEFAGTWKRVMAVSIQNSSQATFGYERLAGLPNSFDGSQHQMKITRTESSWLPVGENVEFRVEETGVLYQEGTFSSRLSFEGSSIRYPRAVFEFQRLVYWKVFCGLFCSDREESYTISFDELENMGFSVKDPSQKPGGSKTTRDYLARDDRNTYRSYAMSCSLMFNNHDRMICVWKDANAGSSDRETLAVLGFSRVKE